MQNDALIKFDRVCFSYDPGEQLDALSDVSVTIDRGAFTAVIGHNGSGKSTFARLCNGLEIPDKGKVWVDGADTSDEDNEIAIRQKVGLVFQDPDNQIVATVVEEDVAFGPENLGLPREEIRRRVDEALRAVGMYELRHREPHMLSGGQKQRVAIAGMIAMRPECIVLDEPTAMLDPGGRKEVLAALKKLNKEQGITIILITHFMEEAVDADRILVMDSARIVLDGTPAEVFSHADELRNYGLELPDVSLMAYELKNRGVDLPDGILRRDELTRALTDSKSLYPLRGASPIKASADAPAPSGQSETILEAKGLSYSYSVGTPFETAAVSDVSFEIKKGELVGVIGHTGSGKSTLIQQLNALLRPDKGVVLLEGRDVNESKTTRRDARFKVGLCFQYPEYQLFEQTVEADIAYGPGNMRLPKDEIAQRVRLSLRYVGLNDSYLKKSPFDLSGGEKRRVAIAGVMAMEPAVLILDEPTAGLDPRGRRVILDLITDYRRRTGSTVIIVSHSMDNIARIADRLLVLDHGSVAFFDTPRAVFSHAAELSAMGLDVPAVTSVMTELSDAGLGVPTDVFTVGEAVDILCSGRCAG